jgi:isopentenyl diphosphate isomerase/L-lactate dehydrogenase-like FMN-dependent dehydrogenase
MTDGLPTIDSVIAAAYDTLDPDLWDYLAGGAESEVTLRRNRAAFEQLALRPRLLRGVGDRDAATTLLGQELAFPVVLAPVGSIGKYHPDGAAACARVAERLGTLAYVSSAADPGLEAARTQSAAPLIWQLYVRGGRSWIEEQLAIADATGCTALCITADVTAPGHRERNLMNFFGGPRGAATSAADHDMFDHQAALTWDDLGWLAQRSALPLVVKGITNGDDARLAVEHGAAVVHVSNHGGRQLDHMRSTMEVLPEVVAAVDGRAEIVVDSGFVRGSDVIKALALGARAVAVGKLMVWGLAADGEDGLEHVLTLLRDEITDLMAHVGVNRLDELTPDHVVAAAAAPQRDWIGFAAAVHDEAVV